MADDTAWVWERVSRNEWRVTSRAELGRRRWEMEALRRQIEALRNAAPGLRGAGGPTWAQVFGGAVSPQGQIIGQQTTVDSLRRAW